MKVCSFSSCLSRKSESSNIIGYFVEERHSDATLFRFLRARKFNVAHAKKMLIEAEKWRKEFEVDKIVS